MLLRLHPEDLTKPIDFRESVWGHAIHGSTFTQELPHKVRERVISWFPFWTREVDEPTSVRRYSFIVHTSDTPAIGREVIWKSSLGDDRVARIYDVKRFNDPRDMMTLYVVMTGE